MIEYPHIINSSKAPRQLCIAFDKLDGSNFRAKWTPKNGFDVFGTRTQLIDESTTFWGEIVKIFKTKYSQELDRLFRKDADFRNEKEIVTYGEFLGPNSFAGFHENEEHDIVFFDVLVGNKNRKFLKPNDFVKLMKNNFPIPRIIYEGNLNDPFIQDVRDNKFDLKEGVICKGTITNGAYRGGIWMCKIKTQKYLDSLKNKFGKEWEKYAE